jgi:hypothetical protein
VTATEKTTPALIVSVSDDDPLVARRTEISRDMLREGIRILQPLERDALKLATRERLPISSIATQLRSEPAIIEKNLRSALLALRQSLLTQLGDLSP